MNKRTTNKSLITIAMLIGLVCIYTSCGASEESAALKIEKHTLKNGMTVLINEDHSHPVVTILATVKAGLSSEGTYAGTGISHFVEHMVFKGTVKMGPGEIEEKVKSLGGTINASTGLDSASYFITVPSEHFQSALVLIEDILFHPAFDGLELEKEREVILKEIKLNIDDPPRRIMRLLWQESYPEHVYGMPVIGYEDLFKGLTRDDLISYHASRYIPNYIIVAIAGDVDTVAALDSAKELFKNKERSRLPEVGIQSESGQNAMRELAEAANVNLGYLSIGYHTVSLADDDTYALDLLSIIMGDWDGSRLIKRLVKESQIAYSVSTFNYTPKYPGLFINYVVCASEKIEAAKREIFKEIEEVAHNGVEPGELNTAKNIVVSSYIDSLETTGGMARAISQSEFFAGDPYYFKNYVESVRGVDNEAIKRVAKKYLGKKNATIVSLYPKSAGKESALSDTKTTLPPGDVGGEARSSVKGGAPIKKMLPNGIRLILKEDHRIPKISAVCSFLGGVRAETDLNNGISNLTSTMLLKGTTKRQEPQIRPIIECRGGSISAFSGKNTFGISLNFLREDTKETLEILGDVIRGASFPESEIIKEKEKIFALIKSQDDDIYSAIFLKLQQALFSSHPYRLRTIGEVDTVLGLTRENVQEFYGRFCVPGNMVISLVGDFDPEEMEAAITGLFSGWRGNAPEFPGIEEEPLTERKIADFDLPREQSIVAAGFRGTTYANNDRFALDILSSILSGENGRLYESVRNNLGLSYSLGTFSVPGIDPGLVGSYIATDKTHLDEARRVLIGELEKVSGGEVTGEEIDLAKTSLIGRHKIFLQTNASLAYIMALDETYDVGYDSYLNYPSAISAVTRDDIVETAKRYIKLDKSVIVTIAGQGNE
ncbi:MAG: pitrilysin family protein [Candidatus Omnitrophota bacterium]